MTSQVLWRSRCTSFALATATAIVAHVVLRSIHVCKLSVLLLSELDQVLSIVLLIFFKTNHCSIHVNGEGNNDI